ncbi:MAG TPA: hypothetical protein GXZ78_02750, partial [Eubacteriaceae bacterium]|nr:hypothetical protein [Eubacteriaceae bacterium]
LRIDWVLSIEEKTPQTNIIEDKIKSLSLNVFLKVLISTLSINTIIIINSIGTKYILPHLKPILSVGWEPAISNNTPNIE